MRRHDLIMPLTLSSESAQHVAALEAVAPLYMDLLLDPATGNYHVTVMFEGTEIPVGRGRTPDEAIGSLVE